MKNKCLIFEGARGAASWKALGSLFAYISATHITSPAVLTSSSQGPTADFRTFIQVQVNERDREQLNGRVASSRPFVNMSVLTIPQQEGAYGIDLRGK